MSEDKVSLLKEKVLDIAKIKARRSTEKCDLGSELIFFYNTSPKPRTNLRKYYFTSDARRNQAFSISSLY